MPENQTNMDASHQPKTILQCNKPQLSGYDVILSQYFNSHDQQLYSRTTILMVPISTHHPDTNTALGHNL